ncbi:hypothetical protein FA15DRAFT_699067 [Coprinopsis marcescibilis]|uniref:TPR-like protein n=1 Tax=Coprinopsis marcescibilis TaxID=230819 RepID=A0A5C3LCP4_COPMA|nr:hypothetical protein FA15DRAFT_699067 [Coprinopsis marcescibilis]
MTTSNDSQNQNLTVRIQDAHDRKSDGNDHFRLSNWNEALVLYRAGLNRLPKSIETSEKVTSLPEGDEYSEQEIQVTGEQTSAVNISTSESLEPGLTAEEELELTKLRAVLHANIAACHVKLNVEGEHKESVAACTEALKNNPSYEKALQRRASSNEAINTWSSLTAAQEDYETLKTLVQSPSQKAGIESKLSSLRPRLEAAQKNETAEMIDKMKGFGNSILGRFGLSTENFKLEPNGQGGYSMNFVK